MRSGRMFASIISAVGLACTFGMAQQVNCAAEEGKATLYFLRDNSKGGKATNGEVWLDGEKICTKGFKPGRYCRVEVTVGPHRIRGSEKENEATLCAAAKAEYYFQVRNVYPPAYWILSYRNYYKIDMLTPDIGRYEMSRLKPINANK